ncbi:MAG: hypothetical protein ACI89S_002571 [Gammaproteobacteria bacterium]|jgi:hypothetical protein
MRENKIAEKKNNLNTRSFGKQIFDYLENSQ